MKKKEKEREREIKIKRNVDGKDIRLKMGL